MESVSHGWRALDAPADTERADRLAMLRDSELDLMIAVDDDARVIAEAQERIGANRRHLRIVRADCG